MAHNIEIHSGYRGTQQERIDAARALNEKAIEPAPRWYDRLLMWLLRGM